MGNRPALSDAMLLGFSYSLTPDGSPGSYNERIARSIRADLQDAVKSGSSLPWVGMQWEIYDALVEQDITDGFKVASFVPKTHVAGPPKFTASEFLNFPAIVDLLKSGSTRAARELCNELLLAKCNLHDPALDAHHLAESLSGLLDDRNGFRRYHGALELHDLHRTRLGAVGTEKRTLPDKNAYWSGLRAFQAIRVNRLIVEAICPDNSVVKPGQYLSTSGVLELLLPQVKEDGRQIKRVSIYGHPQHSPRCQGQTLQSLEAYGWALAESDVIDVHVGQDWPWDPTTAQVWCRSLENWQDYEQMGLRRLSH